MLRLASLSLATLIATSAIATPAFAWDYPGHRIVGAIAEAVLKLHFEEKAYKRVHALLDRKDENGRNIARTLSQVAVFPDCAKSGNEAYCGRPPSDEEKAYADRNSRHGTYHYTDVPIQQQKYVPFSPGTEETDVVRIFRYAVAVLRDTKPLPPHGNANLTKTEAVWLLAHLVGDIHQPLHVGGIYFDKATCQTIVDPNDVPGGMANVVSTFGGNDIYLKSAEYPKPGEDVPAIGPADNLHFYWDGAAVVRAMRAKQFNGDEQDYARVLAAKRPSEWPITGDPADWAEKWAAEILPLAREAHTRLKFDVLRRKEDEPGKVSCKWVAALPADYPDWAAQEAEKQLTKAGFRLAALMVAIFPD